MLHITNGDATRLAEAGVDGEIIVWRDFLHDGPVPAGLDLEAMSLVRAEFIHALGRERPMSCCHLGRRCVRHWCLLDLVPLSKVCG
jgi:hypothetical protein